MNLKLLAKHLGVICLLIGMAMAFSLPWAFPALGHRFDVESPLQFESAGFNALLMSMGVCAVVGLMFRWLGRAAEGSIYRKEAMAIVGVSWVLATVLGGLPYWLASTERGPSVRLFDELQQPNVYAFLPFCFREWKPKEPLNPETYGAVEVLRDAGATGLSKTEFEQLVPTGDGLLRVLSDDKDWEKCLLFPGDDGPSDRVDNYRLRWIGAGFFDSMFESQSGFSTTGATIYSELEDPVILPHCLLFWRSSTHFLGGLGIIVLFVVVLGQGSAGKAMMRMEITGPSKEGTQSRMQHTAWLFAAIYCGLNLILTVVLKCCGLSWFNSLCHAFATMATGGFSTYNASVGHFDSPLIDYVLIVFMTLAGTNFTLLYFCLLRKFSRLFQDAEWQVYLGLILGATLIVVVFGMANHDFRRSPTENVTTEFASAVRFGLFQVVSVITTTGFGTHDFDRWNQVGRGLFLILMFIGGCAGSTGGGMKVIRHILFAKIHWLELEQAFRPNVVRSLQLRGEPIDDPEIRKNVMAYFGFIVIIFVASWLALLVVEPSYTWGNLPDNKLIDSASAVASALNNIGPGLGTVGATQNYGHFSWPAKSLFVWLMMLGRVEVFAILVLFVPGFWRDH